MERWKTRLQSYQQDPRSMPPVALSSHKRKASDIEKNSDGITGKEGTLWIAEETKDLSDLGPVESRQSDGDKLDADNETFITGWDSELTELSEEDGSDESDSDIKRVSQPNHTHSFSEF